MRTRLKTQGTYLKTLALHIGVCSRVVNRAIRGTSLVQAKSQQQQAMLTQSIKWFNLFLQAVAIPRNTLLPSATGARVAQEHLIFVLCVMHQNQGLAIYTATSDWYFKTANLQRLKVHQWRFVPLHETRHLNHCRTQLILLSFALLWSVKFRLPDMPFQVSWCVHKSDDTSLLPFHWSSLDCIWM
jgi:hypothetical protein